MIVILALIVLVMIVILALIALIIIICVVPNSKKGGKDKVIKDWLKEYISSYEKKDDYWLEMYDTILQKHTVGNREDSETVRKCLFFKEKYRTCFANLVNISSDNSVFFSSEEEKNNFWASYGNDTEAANKKITEDIMKTIPKLAEFEDIYKVHEEIFINRLIISASIQVNLEDVKNYADERVQSYAVMLVNCWTAFVHENPSYNTEEYETIFHNILDRDTSVYSLWVDVFNKKLGEIASSDYFKIFIERVKAEHNSPKWAELITSTDFKLSPYSTLAQANDVLLDRGELYRIFGLYNIGVQCGEYKN